MQKLKYHKMWESLAFVFNIDQGTVLPLLESLPRIASYADRNWFFYAKNRGSGGAYYEEGEMAKAKVAGLKDFLDPEYQKGYFSAAAKLLEPANSPLQKIETADLTKISNDELYALIRSSSDYVIEIFGYYLASQPQCTIGIEERTQDELAEFVLKEKVLEVFTLLSTPTELTAIREEEIAWLELLSAKSSGEAEIAVLLETHCEKYHLTHLGDGEVPHPFTYYAEKYQREKSAPAAEITAKLSEIESIGKAIENEKNGLVETYKIPSSITDVTNMLAHLGHMRLEMRINGWMPIQYFSQELIKEAASRFNIPYESLLSATQKEIMELFETGTINLETLNERNESYLYFIDDGVAKLYAGNEADKLFQKLVSLDDHTYVKEFKGNVAMKGKVTGTVALYRWGEDITAKLATMGDDSILVAGQTRPQLMPLIAKSKGIVTDEGGITSHAAIVSRELRIPCIIGTKIATQVLKDGDRIEVDAEKGMVRVLG